MAGGGAGKKPRLPRSERSLACVIQALEGMRLVVELRQDTIIRGVLESADEEMNLVMKGVTMTPLEGQKKELEWLYVKGHHVRFVHIPSKVDPTTIVENNKKRIAQLKILHNREAIQAPAMPKGTF